MTEETEEHVTKEVFNTYNKFLEEKLDSMNKSSERDFRLVQKDIKNLGTHIDEKIATIESVGKDNTLNNRKVMGIILGAMGAGFGFLFERYLNIMNKIASEDIALAELHIRMLQVEEQLVHLTCLVQPVGC